MSGANLGARSTTAGLARGVYRALEQWSEPLALRWAARVTQTPRKGDRGRARVRASLDEGQRLDIELPPERRTSAGRLATWRFGEGPPVILVHDWERHAADFVPLAREIAARGHSAVLFDAPAHGDSSGRRAHLADFCNALWTVAERAGPPAAIAGHGTGAIACALALAEGLPAHRVALLAPALDDGAHSEPRLDRLGVGRRVRNALRWRLEALHRMPASCGNLRVLAPMARIPALVVHDRNDRRVPYEDGELVARLWPRAELAATERLGHEGFLVHPRSLERIGAFLASTTPAEREETGVTEDLVLP